MKIVAMSCVLVRRSINLENLKCVYFFMSWLFYFVIMSSICLRISFHHIFLKILQNFPIAKAKKNTEYNNRISCAASEIT